METVDRRSRTEAVQTLCTITLYRLGRRSPYRPTPIHLGLQLGRTALIELLKKLESHGANHVILNLKYGRRPANDVLEELGAEVVPLFPKKEMAIPPVASEEAKEFRRPVSVS